MIGTRLLYGLDRIPTTLAPDDPRLPSVVLTENPLRLNSIPLPSFAWGDDPTHAGRMRAMETWLKSHCGDYNVALHRFIDCYLDTVMNAIAEHRPAIAADLARFWGLYRAEDWFWSALRPFPRAWWRTDDTWQHEDIAFWDGTRIIGLRQSDSTPDLGRFWEIEALPSSPFRRPLSMFSHTVISST